MSLQIYSIPRVILVFSLRLRGWIHSSLLKVFFIWQILLKMATWTISSDGVCYCCAMRYPDLMVRPRSHAFPDCLFVAGQGANQNSTTPLPLLVSQWDECRPSVWSGSPFYFTLLLSWTQRQSCGQRCWRRIKIKKQACAFLSDVLQDVKDELHHNRLFATLTSTAV